MRAKFAVSRESVTGATECVAIRGDLDIENAREALVYISKALEAEGRGVLVDMTDVGFVDTSGLAVLVQAAQTADALGRQMVVVGCAPQALQVFKLTGVAEFMRLAESREAALAALQAPLLA